MLLCRRLFGVTYRERKIVPMKHAFTIALFALAARFIPLGQTACLSDGGLPGFTPVATIDLAKALATPETSWVKHALQPTALTLRAKRYTGSVAVEKADLQNRLRKVLRSESRPTDREVAKRTAALGDLWDGADYLLLQYTTGAGLRVTIQDGGDLWLLVALPAHAAGSNIDRLVESTAVAVFDLSAAEPQYQKHPRADVLPTDVGPSKVGRLFCGYSPQTQLTDWFPAIGWWSDGQAVLFRVSKGDFAQLATAAHAAPARGPSRFASRRGGATEAPLQK
jgi:hypothetical protein